MMIYGNFGCSREELEKIVCLQVDQVRQEQEEVNREAKERMESVINQMEVLRQDLQRI